VERKKPKEAAVLAASFSLFVKYTIVVIISEHEISALVGYCNLWKAGANAVN
jgi:hypothetical protein